MALLRVREEGLKDAEGGMGGLGSSKALATPSFGFLGACGCPVTPPSLERDLAHPAGELWRQAEQVGDI